MTWFIYHDKKYAVKTHTIDYTLRHLLEQDLSDRYGAVMAEEACKEVEETFFEPGGYGMYYLKQPRTIFTVGGKTLKLDVIKAEEMLFELQDAKRKSFSDGTEYYKLYSRFHCLVVSVAEREELLFQMRGQIDALRAQGDQWLDEREQEWQKNVLEHEKEHGKGSYPIVRVKDLKRDKPN